MRSYRLQKASRLESKGKMTKFKIQSGIEPEPLPFLESQRPRIL